MGKLEGSDHTLPIEAERLLRLAQELIAYVNRPSHRRYRTIYPMLRRIPLLLRLYGEMRGADIKIIDPRALLTMKPSSDGKRGRGRGLLSDEEFISRLMVIEDLRCLPCAAEFLNMPYGTLKKFYNLYKVYYSEATRTAVYKNRGRRKRNHGHLEDYRRQQRASQSHSSVKAS